MSNKLPGDAALYLISDNIKIKSQSTEFIYID